jgi:hypothetical protein
MLFLSLGDKKSCMDYITLIFPSKSTNLSMVNNINTVKLKLISQLEIRPSYQGLKKPAGR